MLNWLFKLLGLVTIKEFEMLKDDLKRELSGLAVDVDDLSARVDAAVANANANSVTEAEVAEVVALRAKIQGVLTTPVE